MRRIATPLASMVLVAASAAACNALNGVADLSQCEACEAGGATLPGPGVEAGGDVSVTDRDGAGAADAREGAAATDAATATDAGADADGATPLGCQGAIACSRVVFVTSMEYDGNLGGIAGADAKCQARADVSTVASIKGRTFQAWVSTSASTVASRFAHGSLPYVEGDGTVVAADWTDLTNGNLGHGIERDELNVSRSNSAWTATSTTGAGYTGRACSDWTSALLPERGGYGNVGGAGSGWSGNGDDGCDFVNALYCFEK